MIDGALFRSICWDLRHPEQDGIFAEPTNVVVAAWVGLPPTTPTDELIVALGAKLADTAHSANSDWWSQQFAAKLRGGAISDGLLASKKYPQMQKLIAAAYDAIGADASDDRLVAHLRAQGLAVRRDNFVRARKGLDRRLLLHSLDV